MAAVSGEWRGESGDTGTDGSAGVSGKDHAFADHVKATFGSENTGEYQRSRIWRDPEKLRQGFFVYPEDVRKPGWEN